MKQVPPELLETIVQRLVDGLKPERVVLFGSHATTLLRNSAI